MNNRLKRILFILIPIYIFIIGLILGYPLFETNDDVYMMNVLSGNITGEPYACTSFFHIFLGFIISTLYRLAYLPWFPLFIIAANLFGQMMLYSALYDLWSRKNISLILKFFALIFMLLISTYLCFLPSYTTSATLIGVASIYCLFKNKKALSIIFLALSLSIRMQSGVVILGFWGLSYIYLHFKNGNKFSLKFIINGFLVIIMALGIYASDEIIKAHIEPEDYGSFNKMQASYNDYGIRELDSDEKEKIISDLNWDNELFELAGQYFSFDNRITADSYRILNSYANSFSIKDNLAYIKKIFQESQFFFHVILFPALFLGIFLLRTLFNKNKDFFIAISVLVLYVMGIMYLSYLGRIIFTSSLALVLPVLIISFLLYSDNNIELQNNSRLLQYADIFVLILICVLILKYMPMKAVLIGLIYSIFRNNSTKVFAVLLVIAFVISAGMLAYDDYNWSIRKEMEYTSYHSQNRNLVEQYCIDNPENIYVIALDLGEDGTILKNKIKLMNFFQWGGTNIHSSAFNKSMERVGMSEFDITQLLKPNVYFISNFQSRAEQLQNALIAKGYHNSFENVYDIGYMKVFKFSVSED